MLEGYPTVYNQIDIRCKVIDIHEKIEGVFTNMFLISTWFCNMGGQALEMYHTKLYLLITFQLKYSYPHWIF